MTNTHFSLLPEAGVPQGPSSILVPKHFEACFITLHVSHADKTSSAHSPEDLAAALGLAPGVGFRVGGKGTNPVPCTCPQPKPEQDRVRGELTWATVAHLHQGAIRPWSWTWVLYHVGYILTSVLGLLSLSSSTASW